MTVIDVLFASLALRWLAGWYLGGRLLTLRSARSDLSFRLESATGRSGAYPDRTFTC